MKRRIAAGIGAAWLALLLVLDAIYGRRLGARVEERLAASLAGTVAIADVDLALVRGHLDLKGLSVVRNDGIGHLALAVDDVRCELAPLGAAVVVHGCGALRVSGTRLEVSTAALFKLRPPRRPPIAADRVVIDDAELAFAPSAFLPNLGRVSVHIDHAEAGRTTFHTPLAWLLALERMTAHIDLPAGLRIALAYDGREVAASGELFGSEVVRVPLRVPAAVVTDARGQIDALVAMGKQLAEDLVAKRAEDWINAKVR